MAVSESVTHSDLGRQPTNSAVFRLNATELGATWLPVAAGHWHVGGHGHEPRRVGHGHWAVPLTEWRPPPEPEPAAAPASVRSRAGVTVPWPLRVGGCPAPA